MLSQEFQDSSATESLSTQSDLDSDNSSAKGQDALEAAFRSKDARNKVDLSLTKSASYAEEIKSFQMVNALSHVDQTTSTLHQDVPAQTDLPKLANNVSNYAQPMPSILEINAHV